MDPSLQIGIRHLSDCTFSFIGTGPILRATPFLRSKTMLGQVTQMSSLAYDTYNKYIKWFSHLYRLVLEEKSGLAKKRIKGGEDYF